MTETPKCSTTIYRLRKENEELIFNSEKEACNFLGVVKCTVSSCYRSGRKCKGWVVEKVGLSTHGETKTRLHKIWESMLERCEYKKHKHFSNYGGRGIAVCDEWHDYTKFRDWAVKNGYSTELTLDRINFDAGYSPNNCRWATIKQQQNNKRNNRFITWNGQTKTMAEWSEIMGMNHTTLKKRLNSHWPVEKALTKPVSPRKRNSI